MKLKVTVKRDDDLKPVQMEIQRGRKKLFLNYAYSPAGDLHSLEFTGRRDELPSIAEIMGLVDKKRLDRIGTIEWIDLVSRITLIDEITDIGTIGEITTIKDLFHSVDGFIKNPSFGHGDFLGWGILANCVINDIYELSGTYCCRFNDVAAATTGLGQVFHTPVKTDWISEFVFYAQAGNNCSLSSYILYDDLSDDTEVHNLVGGAGYAKKTIAMDAAKYMLLFYFHTPNPDTEPIYIDNVHFLF